MTATAMAATGVDVGLLAAFAAHHHLLGGQAAYRRARLAAVEAFVTAHPDLDGWLDTPLEDRLLELHRHPFAWSVVSFAIVSGRCRPDPEFLFAKSFGHTLPRWVAGLFPASVTPPPGSAPTALTKPCAPWCRWRWRSLAGPRTP